MEEEFAKFCHGNSNGHGNSNDDEDLFEWSEARTFEEHDELMDAK